MADGITKPELLEYAWRSGYLSYKLHDYQLPLYKLIVDGKSLKFVLNASRRFGKSYILSLYAVEFALRHPNSLIRFAAPTGKALRKIILPIFKQIFEDCPQGLQPSFASQDCFYKFANGSEIHLAGTDSGAAENLRGQASHLNIIDEAADVDNLDYVYRSILLPQTLTTGGRTILASTPPKTPAHDFYSIAIEAEAAGEYAKYTIYENKSLPTSVIDEYARESGGYDSTHFKREYLCEFIVDEDSVIIPEFNPDLHIKEPQRDHLYPYWHKYVGMDLGVKDFTACIFGYYDFKRATLVIEDEFTMSGPDMTTVKLSKLITETESKLWADKRAYRRVADNNNLLLIQDLSSLHNLHFMPTSKDSLDAMVNELRMLVAANRLEIAPHCKQLIGCLRYGIWSTSKTKREFGRSKVYGHYDHLAAIIYLVRNLATHTNPVPASLGHEPHRSWIPTRNQHSNNATALANILLPKRAKH